MFQGIIDAPYGFTTKATSQDPLFGCQASCWHGKKLSLKASCHLFFLFKFSKILTFFSIGASSDTRCSYFWLNKRHVQRKQDIPMPPPPSIFDETTDEDVMTPEPSPKPKSPKKKKKSPRAKRSPASVASPWRSKRPKMTRQEKLNKELKEARTQLRFVARSADEKKFYEEKVKELQKKALEYAMS